MMSRLKPTEKNMDLLLWRHAEAEEFTAKVPDARRRLTERGERQARMMARWLQRHVPKKLRILVSPSERTQMTAHALGLPFEIEQRIAPDANPSDLIAASGWPDYRGAVLLVGHQPTLGRLAARLLSGEEADWTIKKGGLWWISSRTRDGEIQTLLRTVIHPDLI